MSSCRCGFLSREGYFYIFYFVRRFDKHVPRYSFVAMGESLCGLALIIGGRFYGRS